MTSNFHTNLLKDISSMLDADDYNVIIQVGKTDNTKEFYLEELVNYLQEYLIDERTCWVQQNFVFILNTIFNLSKYKKLQDYCILSICEDPFLVFSLSDFPSLNKDILFYLIKRDDL